METNLNQAMQTVAKNLEQAPPELKKHVNGEVTRLADAISAPRILNGNREDLIKSLRYAMMKIGLREQNWPTKEETALLVQHIEKNYGGHTMPEIRLAFDLAISGQIGAEPNCYENFSCLYFSNIMSAYREWAKEEYKQIESKSIPKIEYKEDMSKEAMQDWFNEKVKEIKAGKLTVDFVPLMLYEWMDANGNITATTAQKYMYLQRAADYRQSQLEADVERNDCTANKWRLSTFISQKNRGYFEGEEVDTVKCLAKKILLFDLII